MRGKGGKNPVRKDAPTAARFVNRPGREDRASVFRKARVPRSPASQVCSGAIAAAGPSCGPEDVFEVKMRRQGQSSSARNRRGHFPCS